MATDKASEQGRDILARLRSEDWTLLREGVIAAGAWLRSAVFSDPFIEKIGYRFLALMEHPKWEVRKELVHASERSRHASFDLVLNKLSSDENAWVRSAAQESVRRRRMWAQFDTLQGEHADLVRDALDTIEAKHGVRARETVNRLAERLVGAFVREAHHEIVKVIAPMRPKLGRLTKALHHDEIDRSSVLDDVSEISDCVTHLMAVLDSLKAFTAQVKPNSRMDSLTAAIEQSIDLVKDDFDSRSINASFRNDVAEDLAIEMDRSRLVQAFSNLLHNAIEAYEGTTRAPVVSIRARVQPGVSVTVLFTDTGCGMSPEVLRDAPKLFSSRKQEHARGFGLPLAIKIIESEHGGSLSIESSVGKGTTVTVILPTQQERS